MACTFTTLFSLSLKRVCRADNGEHHLIRCTGRLASLAFLFVIFKGTFCKILCYSYVPSSQICGINIVQKGAGEQKCCQNYYYDIVILVERCVLAVEGVVSGTN